MTNHLHLLANCENENLSEIIRDLKKHTSKKIIETIITEPESRKEWMLNLFSFEASNIQGIRTFNLDSE